MFLGGKTLFLQSSLGIAVAVILPVGFNPMKNTQYMLLACFLVWGDGVQGGAEFRLCG